MFGHQFYPTPKTVIAKMVEGLDLRDKRIIDPSAGRGDILDYVKITTGRHFRGEFYSSRTHLFAIEIDPDLRQVLVGKGYKVIDSDFLLYCGQRYFDYFLMNPPFDNGAAHLLHAWEISHGAVIRCLLNAETIRNPYTQERKRLLHLVEQYGSVEFLGQPFLNSDNPTPVEIVMVTLQNTREVEAFRLDFDPSTIGVDRLDIDEGVGNELASSNIFENYEARHLAAISAFKELFVVCQKVAYYFDPLLTGRAKTSASVIKDSLDKPDPNAAYEEFLVSSTELAWDHIFEKTKLGHVTTESVRKEIEKMKSKQGNMAFTASNMEDLFFLLAGNREQIMVNCVLEAFDLMTRYYNENKAYVEGWKTNSGYRVGKFILPYMGSQWGDGLSWDRARDLDDIEKALCFLSGKRFDHIDHMRTVYDHKSYFGQWMTSEFFETKLFKKGTMHFKWRDENLCTDFNALVGQHRPNWVPEKTKSGVYR